MEVKSTTPRSSAEQLRRLYRFMAKGQFVASRDELVANGFSPARIKNWIRGGRLIKIFRAVYSYGRDVDSPDAVRRAALLAAGSDSALIGRSACEAWGIVRPGPGLPRVVEVGAPTGQVKKISGTSPALRDTTVSVARRKFQPGDVCEKDGLVLTSVPVALIEFSAKASDREIRFAFLEACRLRLFDEKDVKYCFSRLYRRRGARKLRPYLTLWVPELNRIRSVFEGWFLLEWVARGYPMPEVNVKLFGYEVDFYWAAGGLVLELDGDAFHSDPVQKRLDLEKQRLLESRGATVKRVTFKEFEADTQGILDQVARRLGLL